MSKYHVGDKVKLTGVINGHTDYDNSRVLVLFDGDTFNYTLSDSILDKGEHIPAEIRQGDHVAYRGADQLREVYKVMAIDQGTVWIKPVKNLESYGALATLFMLERA